MNNNENNIDQAVDILLCMINGLAKYDTNIKSTIMPTGSIVIS